MALIMRSTVDLPQPDGPIRTQKAPGSMRRLTPWTAGVAPKDFDTSFSSIIGAGVAGAWITDA